MPSMLSADLVNKGNEPAAFSIAFLPGRLTQLTAGGASTPDGLFPQLPRRRSSVGWSRTVGEPSPEHVGWILGDSGAVAVVVETDDHAEKIAAARAGLPALSHA